MTENLKLRRCCRSCLAGATLADVTVRPAERDRGVNPSAGVLVIVYAVVALLKSAVLLYLEVAAHHAALEADAWDKTQ